MVNRNQGDKPGLTNQDLQAGSYLVKDYREIILSQDVLEKVATDLKLELPPKGLASKIKVTVPVDTRIVSISVTDRVPERSKSDCQLFERGCCSKNHQCNARFRCDYT